MTGRSLKEAFRGVEAHNLVLIATGTGAGGIFQKPTRWQKIGMYLKAGFYKKKAKEFWLKEFTFLKAGDLLTFSSPILGWAQSLVRDENMEGQN